MVDMESIKAVLMDLDGTVYQGNELIPGSKEIIDCIREIGIRLFFFTNNSGKTREDISNKLNLLGIDCSIDDIVSSGYAAAMYLKEQGISDTYICGTDALKLEFDRQGIKHSDSPSSKTMVIGFDSDYDYQKMKKAINAALSAEVIIACNLEKTYPCDNGDLCPGCGAMVSSIEFCSNKKSNVVIGKPNRYMFDYVKRLTGFDNQEIIVIGDTYESDIVMASLCSARSILISSNHQDCTTVSSIIEV